MLGSLRNRSFNIPDSIKSVLAFSLTVYKRILLAISPNTTTSTSLHLQSCALLTALGHRAPCQTTSSIRAGLCLAVCGTAYTSACLWSCCVDDPSTAPIDRIDHQINCFQDYIPHPGCKRHDNRKVQNTSLWLDRLHLICASFQANACMIWYCCFLHKKILCLISSA